MAHLNPSETAAQKLHTMLLTGKPAERCQPVKVGISKAGVSYNLYPDRFTCPMAFRKSVERMVESLTRKGGEVLVGETAPLSALLPSYGRMLRVPTTPHQSDAFEDVLRWYDPEGACKIKATFTEVPLDLALGLAEALESEADVQEDMYSGDALDGPELDFALRQVRKPYDLAAKKLRDAYRRAVA